MAYLTWTCNNIFTIFAVLFTQKTSFMIYPIVIASIIIAAYLVSRGLESGNDISKY